MNQDIIKKVLVEIIQEILIDLDISQMIIVSINKDLINKKNKLKENNIEMTEV